MVVLGFVLPKTSALKLLSWLSFVSIGELNPVQKYPR
jgi:hypothetical protein